MNKPLTGRVYSMCDHESRRQAGEGALEAAPGRRLCQSARRFHGPSRRVQPLHVAWQAVRDGPPRGWLARRIERYAQCRVGFALEARFISAQKHDRRDDHRDPDDRKGQIDGPGKTQELLAEQVGGNTVERRPDDAARRIEEEEAAPAHAVDPGEEGRKDAQYRNKPPEEHHLGPVLVEQVLAKPKPVLLQPDVASVVFHQPVAAGSADQVADVVPDDRARRRSNDDPKDRETARRPGVNRGGNQHRLYRNWNADTLDADEDEDRQVAIGREQAVEVARQEVQHSGVSLPMASDPGYRQRARLPKINTGIVTRAAITNSAE